MLPPLWKKKKKQQQSSCNVGGSVLPSPRGWGCPGCGQRSPRTPIPGWSLKLGASGKGHPGHVWKGSGSLCSARTAPCTRAGAHLPRTAEAPCGSRKLSRELGMVCSCQQPPSPWDRRDGPVPCSPAPCPWSWPWVLVLPASPPSTAPRHGAKQDCQVCAHTLCSMHCCWFAHSPSSACSISRWAWYLGKMCVCSWLACALFVWLQVALYPLGEIINSLCLLTWKPSDSIFPSLIHEHKHQET